MHHNGLGGNQDKIDAFRELKELSRKAPFTSKKITMGGFLITDTALQDIPGAEKMTPEELERGYRVLRQAGDYIAKILNPA